MDLHAFVHVCWPVCVLVCSCVFVFLFVCVCVFVCVVWAGETKDTADA